MIASVLFLSLAGPAVAAPVERPPMHRIQIPWWERAPRETPLLEPSDPPTERPYHLGEFEFGVRVVLTEWYAGSDEEPTEPDLPEPDLTETYLPLLLTFKELGIPATICTFIPWGFFPELTPAQEAVRRAGYEPEELGEWVPCYLDTIWMRDFGPFVSQTANLRRVVGNAGYYFDRPNDDSFPELFAEQQQLRSYGIPLDFEGGNFFSDGNGTCFATTIISWFNPDQDVAAVFRDYLGCERTILLEPLEGEGTGHIDMYFAPVDRENVIVGSYDPEYDEANAAILDDNAAVLEAAGLTVHRVPMPSHRDGNDDGWDDFRTYVNGLHIRLPWRHVYLAPVYRDDTEHEEAALAALARAMPGVEIVPIDSTTLIGMGGAIHCITKVVPVRGWPDRCNDQWDFNDEGCEEERRGLLARLGCATAPGASPLGLLVGLLALRRRRVARQGAAR